MRLAVRQELDRIEAFLLRMDADSADLLAILTALRSRDMPVEFDRVMEAPDKLNTTGALRTAVFPKLYRATYDNCGAVPRVGTGPVRRYFRMAPADICIQSPDKPGHFYEHHRLAIAALNRIPVEDK